MFDSITPIILFALGIVIIVKGGDLFVDAARWVSLVTGIPRIIVGATVVSLATTLPEMMVSALATYHGSIEMAAGNAVGSVMANIGVGLSVSMLTYAGIVKKNTFTINSIMMIAATVLLFLLSLDGVLTTFESLPLVALVGLFFYTGIKYSASTGDKLFEEHRPKPYIGEIAKNILFFVVGCGGIIYGATLLVENGSILARYLGVSEAVIGVTVIAVGTSLPELITAITAAVKKEYSLSVGNVIGANIIDICLILPICSVISGGSIAVPSTSIRYDIPMTFFLIALAIVPVLFFKRFYRLQGVLLILLYIGYLAAATVYLGG